MVATPSAGESVRPKRRIGATPIAIALGVPLAAGVLALVNLGPLHGSTVARYLEHPAEQIEVVMCCIALCALGVKLVSLLPERTALARQLLPAWDGKAVPVAEARALQAELERQPRRLQGTYLGRRIAAVLEFLSSRGSAAELDDQMRFLAETDSLTMDASYSLIRFLTWAMPIIGFLGTVLGITKAISGVDPATLEKNLGQVTGGLAEAFDATALALGLTMVVMFVSFLIERMETSIVEAVDRAADLSLAHRFERGGAESGEFVGALSENTRVLLQATEKLVERQAAVWAKSLTEMDKRRTEVEQGLQERLAAALGSAMRQTEEAHARRLADLEKQNSSQAAVLMEKVTALTAVVRDANQGQQAALARISEGLTAQAQALAQLQGGERQLVRLQEALNENLSALAGAGAFEQAVHSLTAAIHLLTARAAPPAAKRPGSAA